MLVAGLGNRLIVSDSLGTRCVEKLHVTRDLNASSLQSVCALSTGVSGMTGMQYAEIISGVVSKIKPCAVILVDSLATSMAKRLGRSFQISSAGIAPGSGVGLDKERIDKSTLGVPAISIGVPMMLALRTAIYSFIKDYASKQDGAIDEFSLRERLKEIQCGYRNKRRCSCRETSPRDNFSYRLRIQRRHLQKEHGCKKEINSLPRS